MSLLFKFFVLIGIVIAGIIIGGGIAGYAMNIIQIFSIDFTEVDTKETLKIIGIAIPPIGAVMGWIG